MPPPPPPPPSAPPPPPPMGFVPYAATATTSPPYAGFWQRVAGLLLDQLLYGLLLAVFAIPTAILAFNAFEDCRWIEGSFGESDELICPPGSPDGAPLAIAILIGLIGLVVVGFLYFRALARTGQTWGRQIVGIRVVRTTGDQPLGWGLAFLRSFLEAILSGNCILGYLWMLWDKNKQTWHDKIVNTVVVRV